MPLDQLGPYKIERMLGRGGMGAVYAGLNEGTGERAAIKVLSPVLADDPGFRERFKAEIETLKKLRHPNIVQLHGYGEHDGHLFYAMELVEGRNLQDELQSGRKFDWREVCRIGIAICQGLKHAHDVGVIHRDLKPANLLVTRDGTVKLSDFGIAKLYGMSHLTADGGVLGTADYMAPEQADGRPVTTRCDMYSLGSVLYALLARRPPFAAPTMAEVLHALKYDTATPVRRYAPMTPLELESILIELLDKDPQRRVATPLVLSNRLKAMLHALADDPDEVDEKEHDFEVRIDDDPSVPLSAQTTMGSSMAHAGSEHVTFAPTPTRPMIDTPDETPPTKVETAPPSAPARHFTLVDKHAPRQRETPPVEDDGTPIWMTLTAASVLVALLGGLGWYVTRPDSADSLYAKIAAAAEQEDPSAFSSVESQIDEFLAYYANDPRHDEVTSYQQELDIYRLQRGLEFRARRLRGKNPLLPVEQALLEAMSFERTAPDKAVERYEALIDVFHSDGTATRNTKRCVELARRQLVVLEERLARSREEHETVLTGRLDEARALAEKHPEEAKTIVHGIITLYGDKAWAQEPVAQAKQLLQELAAAKEAASP